MPWLAADSDPASRSSTWRTLYVLLTKHSFPSRLHQEPTVHKSVPRPVPPRRTITAGLLIDKPGGWSDYNGVSREIFGQQERRRVPANPIWGRIPCCPPA